MAEIEVEMTAHDKHQLIVSGLATLDDDGGLTLTAEGNAWLKEWCEKKLKGLDKPIDV